jgi:hypothetical protein
MATFRKFEISSKSESIHIYGLFNAFVNIYAPNLKYYARNCLEGRENYEDYRLGWSVFRPRFYMISGI